MTAEVHPQANRSFRVELTDFLQQIPWKGAFGVLLLAWLALFHFLGNSTLGYVKSMSLFRWLIYCYDNSVDDEHGYLIPFVVLLLYWHKRNELVVVPKAPWWPALLLILFASALHLAGFFIQQTRLSVMGFFLGLYALTGLVWGWRWLVTTFFPFCLFVFSLPLSVVQDKLTLPLRMMATKLSVVVAHILGINVQQQGTRIFDAHMSYQYEVAAACSGLRSLTAISAMAVIIAFLLCRSPWRRLAVLVGAVPMAVAANVLRLSMIIIAAETFGQKTGDWVHANGWMSMLPYVPAFIGLLVWANWLRDDRTKRAENGGSEPPLNLPPAAEQEA